MRPPKPPAVTTDSLQRDRPESRRGPLGLSWLWLELVVLFFAVPGLLAAWVDPHRRFDGLFRSVGLGAITEVDWPRSRVLMPALLLFVAFITLWLLLDRSFPKRQLWNWRAARRDLPRVLGLFVLGGAAMLGVAWLLAEYTGVMTITRDGQTGTAFLRLPREAPWILVIIALAYPWFSAYPQEITHRAFFFHRYAPILRTPRTMIAVNALAFAWLHAPFWSGVALLMTFLGGVLFAVTYHKTRSTLAAGIEHAIYGWWAFFVGLGWFVFAGSVGQAASAGATP